MLGGCGKVTGKLEERHQKGSRSHSLSTAHTEVWFPNQYIFKFLRTVRSSKVGGGALSVLYKSKDKYTFSELKKYLFYLYKGIRADKADQFFPDVECLTRFFKKSLIRFIIT